MPYHFFDVSREDFWKLSSKSIHSCLEDNSKWDNYEVGEYIIKGEVKNWASSTRFEINRKSLGFYIYSNHSKHAGQCYKGFKEYEKQI